MATLKIEPMGPAPAMPRKHAMPGANGTGINPNLKISTDIKPMAPAMPGKHAMPVPAVNGIPFGAHAPGFNRTGINPNPKIAFKEAMETPAHMFEGDTAELPVNKTISNDEEAQAPAPKSNATSFVQRQWREPKKARRYTGIKKETVLYIGAPLKPVHEEVAAEEPTAEEETDADDTETPTADDESAADDETLAADEVVSDNAPEEVNAPEEKEQVERITK